MLLLDSNVFSHLVLGSAAKRAAVQDGLAELLRSHVGAQRATSGLCVAECLVAARRIGDPVARDAAERAFNALFRAPDLHVVPVSAEVLDRAAALRAGALRRAAMTGTTSATDNGGRLKLPDAIVAASCLAFDPPALLVTENESDFTWVDDQGSRVHVGGLEVARVG